MYSKLLFAIPFGLLISCKNYDTQQEKLYVELRKDHENYIQVQSIMDKKIKTTEEKMLILKDSAQKELGYFSNDYHQLNESITEYLSALEEKASRHNDLISQQAALEDEILSRRLSPQEITKREKAIKIQRERIERDFELSLSKQDTMVIKIERLIEKS